jgi:hypothetical protein
MQVNEDESDALARKVFYVTLGACLAFVLASFLLVL